MMNNNDDILKPEDEFELKHQSLYKGLEMEMEGASALMEAEAMLDSKNSDYVQGFISGFAHCLRLGERFDNINNEKLRNYT
jgi:hypothetical protein